MKTKDYNRRAINQFGRALERLRESKELTRAELAEKAGMHYDSLLRLERGDRTPNLGTACNLADTLGVRVVELLEG